MRPSFPSFFLANRKSLCWFGGVVCWHLWIGGARYPRQTISGLAVEVFNVGGWLPRGDCALDVDVDFLAVVEHRLIPARVRSEYATLRTKDISSAWAPASQKSSHVGNAGVY